MIRDHRDSSINFNLPSRSGSILTKLQHLADQRCEAFYACILYLPNDCLLNPTWEHDTIDSMLSLVQAGMKTDCCKIPN